MDNKQTPAHKPTTTKLTLPSRDTPGSPPPQPPPSHHVTTHPLLTIPLWRARTTRAKVCTGPQKDAWESIREPSGGGNKLRILMESKGLRLQ